MCSRGSYRFRGADAKENEPLSGKSANVDASVWWSSANGEEKAADEGSVAGSPDERRLNCFTNNELRSSNSEFSTADGANLDSDGKTAADFAEAGEVSPFLRATELEEVLRVASEAKDVLGGER